MSIRQLNFLLSVRGSNKAWIILCTLLCITVQNSYAWQTPIQITSITVGSKTSTRTTYQAAAPSDADNVALDFIGGSVNYGIRNGGVGFENDTVTSYTLNGYGDPFDFFLAPDTVAIRRTDGSRFINIWYELFQTQDNSPSLDSLVMEPEAVEDADLIYKNNNINSGYDNILVNRDNEGNNLIQAQTERVDIIWYNGIVTCNTDNAVFPVVERGGNDSIKVAAILSLDANGDPDEYSPLLLIRDQDWPQAGQSYDNFLILRRQNFGDDPLPLLNIGTFRNPPEITQTAQIVQGVAFSFTQFDIDPGQIVYGYSLFASDVTSSHDLTDFASFPNNTISGISGLDLVAGLTAAVSSDDCLTPATGPGGYKAALSTWLKANGVNASTGVNDVTSSASQGASVTDWQDHWIGNHDFTTDQGTPTYNLTSSLINFNPSVEFLGTSSLTTADNEDFNSAASYDKKGINIQFRTSTSPLTFNTLQVLYEQGDEDRGLNIFMNSGNLHVAAWNRTVPSGSPWNTGTPITTISSTTLSTDTEYIVTLELNGNASNTGTLTAYLNGQSFGTLSNVGLLYDQTGTDGDITLGGAGTGDGSQYNTGSNTNLNSFRGEISEFIYCNSPSSFLANQRRRIESYLALKYGITLDQSTPISYYNSQGDIIYNTSLSTANGGYISYNNDIAGIGRDDASELSQLQSKSENTGSKVTMARGTEFPKDNTWLIWGNDAGAYNDNTTTGLPSGIGRRVDRVWRVAETNNSGLVSVSFDLTGTSFTGSNYSLLIAPNASNGSFSAAQIVTGGTLVGSTLTFENVDFSNGQFFTLGTAFSTDCGPGGETTNLSVWLKANLGTSSVTNDASLSSWADLSGNGNNASQGTPANQPAYKANYVNFNPAVHFDELNDVMIGSGGFYSNGFYLVLIPDSDIQDESNAQAPIGFGSNAAEGGFYLGDGLTQLAGAGTYNNLVSFYINKGGANFIYEQHEDDARVLAAENPLIYSIRSLNASSTFAFAENGLTLTTSTFAGTYQETTSGEVYALAADWNVINNFDGKIAEFISFSSDPSTDANNKIESYLAIKYGITLDQTSARNYVAEISSVTTTIWDGTTNATYNSNIAGIGRDDDSCLEQKQSKSVNSGSVVTMGIGGISTSNATNPNSFSADDSFLIWGSDGSDPDATPITTQLPGNVTARMDPIWRVEETGTVGNVSVSFDLTGLTNFTSRSASDYQLIIASSGSTMPDLSGADTYSGGTFDGNVITFNNVDFADGDYFTLGTARTSCAPGGVSTGLALWLKADDGTNGTTDGSNVTTWTDQTGSFSFAANTLGGSNPTNPTYEIDEINFNPAVRFYDPNSTNGVYMNSTDAHSVVGDLSMVVVYKSGQAQGTTDDFQNSPVFVSTNASGNDLDYGLGMANGRLFTNAANNNNFNAESPASPLYNTLEPFIATATRVSANTAGSINLYANSASVASGTSTNNNLNSTLNFAIGNHPGDTNEDVDAQLSGRISEVIVFSDDLTGTQRQQVESYLAIKYGITRDVASLGASEQDYLASDGTTVFFDWDENTTYRSDIAGVGRDDGSCLTQTKSKSENNDAIVTMEVSSFGSDDSFLMWANDNATIESTANREYPSGYNSRLNREWRVQETGTVSSATITFDLSDITGPTGIGTNNLNEVVMLVDADGDFTGGLVAEVEATSFDAINKTITFTYNFTDGQYFTLASSEKAALPIELIAFNANALENSVYLSWTTASEENNAYYSIERSADGESFETIAEMDGAGFSNTILNYRYTDRQPLNGRSYYRLKQNDFNGNYSYSEIRGVLVSSIEKYDLEVYPNPVSKTEQLAVRYQLPAGVKGQLSIINMQGKSMINVPLVASDQEKTIDISQFNQGVYLVMIQSDEGIKLTERIIIKE